MKTTFLITVLLILCGGAGLKAQTDSQNGAITIKVKRYCHVCVYKPCQPLHFSQRNTKRRRKRVKVTSNHAWQLLVRPQEKYFRNLKGRKLDRLNIEYYLEKRSGKGSLNNPGTRYKLFYTPDNPPSGTGTVLFDVMFDLDLGDFRIKKWGNCNVKVEFVCSPTCF